MLTALLTLALAQNAPITLYRGSDIAGSDTKYWSVEDTQIDKSDPVRSSGQGLVLFLGKDKRAFLRFGDLRRALGPNKRIVSAKLILTPAYITSGGNLTLHRFGTSWHESAGTGNIQPTTPAWSTSWNFRHFGERRAAIRWRDGGSEFLAATPSAQQQVEITSDSVVLDGLAADVQSFYDKWYDNNGWALQFSGDGGFNSAEGRQSGPRLELVTENVASRAGADLSVTYIERTPEYKRYDNRGAYVPNGESGMGVLVKPGEADTKKWPSDGEAVTYTAHIKNVGSEPASGFTFEWSETFALANSGDSAVALAPGQETTVALQTKFKNDQRDHRTMPVSIRIKPKGDDALAANDFLEIQANALNIGIYLDQAYYAEFSKQTNTVGSHSFEDWIQWQFRIWNDVFLKHSRFSFAEDGGLERMRVGRITIVPTGSIGEVFPAGEPNLVYDGEWGFGDISGIGTNRTRADRDLLYGLSHRVGLIALETMSVPPSNAQGEGGRVRLQVNGRTPTRGSVDPYPGLMGGGDTRNELLIPAQIAVPNTPTRHVVYTSPLFLPTDLYSRTEIAALNANVGFRRGFYGEYLYSIPKINILRISDRNGNLLDKGTLRFYQMSSGEIRNEEPAFVLDFDKGVARLPDRQMGLASPFTTLTGHTLAPNPFGPYDVSGANGVFLIRLDYAGQVEWTWLKAWQLFDMFARGNKSIATNELRFNVATKPIKEQDWAFKKTAIDSINSSGDNLAALLDGNPSTAYRAGDKVGDWVEIDIGRDRPIGEVRLLVDSGSAFWQSFDVMVYGTGQTFSQARTFAGEGNWPFAAAMQRDVEADGRVSVAYRSAPQTVRFIRFVNKLGGPGSTAGIEIRETDIGQ
ncbi:MAG: hypothetical protein M3R13_10640 [Armatimonadota bacterium]|nr:hypothetical protein [Armatimonadota bacterium]